MRELAYVRWLTRQIFKMLPMSDSDTEIESTHLNEFINSIAIQMDGSFVTFPLLRDNEKYIAVANVIHYWDGKDLLTFGADRHEARTIFKREIKKVLDLLNKIEQQLGGAE